jgi:hypothetical protein
MALERDFEEYEGGPTIGPRVRIHVTLRQKGQIYFNTNTHRMLGRPEAVKLYYSRERDTIAIAPANPRQPKNFPVRPDVNGYKIYAAPFLRHYRIPCDNSQRFINADIDADGCLILELAKTVNIDRPQPKKRAKG